MKTIEFKFWRWRVELTIESLAQIRQQLATYEEQQRAFRERDYIVIHSRDELLKFMPDRYWCSVTSWTDELIISLPHNRNNPDDEDTRDCRYELEPEQHDNFIEWLGLQGYTDSKPLSGDEDEIYISYYHPERRDYWQAQETAWVTPMQQMFRDTFDNMLERIDKPPWVISAPSYYEPLLDDDFDDEPDNLS